MQSVHISVWTDCGFATVRDADKKADGKIPMLVDMGSENAPPAAKEYQHAVRSRDPVHARNVCFLTALRR